MVTVIVTRNPHAPEFSQTNYEETIDENAVVGHNVLQLMATDADNVRWGLNGDCEIYPYRNLCGADNFNN